MNTGHVLARVAVGLVGLVLAGMLAVWLLKALLGLALYLVVGALVVAGGAYLYHRLKRAVGSGTRAQRRIEAAAKTYRMRKG
jgi:hypothetical protein